ncbi:MAG: endonuclease/exonuclease/phosphatase family protein [Candidatus Helarchaeota archaeon]|nr:endonuclease/exonuclease/phosphatase family protein [Candidatus Helarchaeota archaeon]
MTIKKKIVLILLLVPLIVSIIYSAIPLQVRSPNFDDTHQVKFMTYNIHFSVGMDDRVDLERILQNILIENPDIIGLQEVENGRITSQGVDAAFWLARALGMYHYYYPALNEHAFGVALLSRYPIINLSAWQLPTDVWERVLIRGTIQLNGSFWIDVFVTHLGLKEDNRTAQVEFILSRTSQVTRPMVLMGDFNLRDNTSEIATIVNVGGFNDTAKDYNNTNPGFTDTYPSWPFEPQKRIDYIFATDFTSLINSKVINDTIPSVHAPWEYGSDHLPVVTTLQY